MICTFDFFLIFFALCKFELQKLEKSTYLLEIECLHDSPLCLCLRLDKNHNKQTIKHKITNDLECKQGYLANELRLGRKSRKFQYIT